MPSFAKAAATSTNPLISLWKDHPDLSPLTDLLSDSRTRAAEILRVQMPGKLAHLRGLIAQETNPESLLWLGHLESGDYVAPRLIQPDNVPRLISDGIAGPKWGLDTADMRVGERIVLPDEISQSTTRHAESTTPLSEMSEDTLIGQETKFAPDTSVEKGVQVGSHWFEVVPRNIIQTDVIMMTLKEHEDLHIMATELKLWLELEIPLIEDGNSFGADVQNHLIREIDLAHKKSNSFHNGLRQHHSDRIKLAVDWVKHPNVLDYPAAIAHSDRFDHFLARSYLRQLLMTYGGLMTKFQRNWDKVINPKGDSSSSVGGMY